MGEATSVDPRVPDISGVHPDVGGISKHGWARFIERSPERRQPIDYDTRVDLLKRALGRAVEVQLKPCYRVAALCNNRFEAARYYRGERFVFVVSVRTGLIMTVHTGEARRWEPMRET